MTTASTWRSLSGVVLVCGTLLASEACASSGRRAYVRLGPPAPIVEARIVSPGPGHVWVAGYQRWNGNRYVWMPGSWVAPPRPRAAWMPGRWVHARHGWYYVDGHWR